MVPKQLGDEIRRDHADDRSLEGKIVSVRPSSSPARSLRSLLNRRLEQLADANGGVSRKPWPIGVRLLVMIIGALAAWAIVVAIAWLAVKLIF